MITSRLPRKLYPASRRSHRASLAGCTPLRRFPLLNNAPPHRTRSVQTTAAPPPVEPHSKSVCCNTAKRYFISRANDFSQHDGVGAPSQRRAHAVRPPGSAADHHGLEAGRLAELPQVAKVAGIHLVTGLREQGHGGVHHVLRARCAEEFAGPVPVFASDWFYRDTAKRPGEPCLLRAVTPDLRNRVGVGTDRIADPEGGFDLVVHVAVAPVNGDQCARVKDQCGHAPSASFRAQYSSASRCASRRSLSASASSSSVNAPNSAWYSSMYSRQAAIRRLRSASSKTAASSSARNLSSAAATIQSSTDRPCRAADSLIASVNSGARVTLIVIFTLSSYGGNSRSPKEYPGTRFPGASAP